MKLGIVGLAAVTVQAAPASATHNRVGRFTAYPVPAPAGAPGCSAQALATGPDGSVYAALGSRATIAKLPVPPSHNGDFSFYEYPPSDVFPGFNVPGSPRFSPTAGFPAGSQQMRRHTHDLAFRGNTIGVSNPHVRPGPTGFASELSLLNSDLTPVAVTAPDATPSPADNPPVPGARRTGYMIPNQRNAGTFTFLGGITPGPGGFYAVTSEGDLEEISYIPRDGGIVSYIVNLEDTPGVSLEGPIVYANGYVWASATKTESDGEGGTRSTNNGVILRIDPSMGAGTGAEFSTEQGNGTDPVMIVRTPNITQFDAETGFHLGAATSGSLMVGSDGALWYTEQKRIIDPASTATPPANITVAGGRIARLDPKTGLVTHFSLPSDANPVSLTSAGGKVYFTSAAQRAGTPAASGENYLGRLDPATGKVDKAFVPATAGVVLRSMGDVVTGGDGNVYFGYAAGMPPAPAQCSIGRFRVPA